MVPPAPSPAQNNRTWCRFVTVSRGNKGKCLRAISIARFNAALSALVSERSTVTGSMFATCKICHSLCLIFWRSIFAVKRASSPRRDDARRFSKGFVAQAGISLGATYTITVRPEPGPPLSYNRARERVLISINRPSCVFLLFVDMIAGMATERVGCRPSFRASCAKLVDQHILEGGLELPSSVPAADRLMRCTQ